MLLQKRTKYGKGYNKDTPVIRYLWRVLDGLNTEQRQAFLKFVWGRNRLPASELDFGLNNMKVNKLEPSKPTNSPDIMLPKSHT